MHNREIKYIIYKQITFSIVNRWSSLLGIKNEQYTTTVSNWVQTQGFKITVGRVQYRLKLLHAVQ